MTVTAAEGAVVAPAERLLPPDVHQQWQVQEKTQAGWGERSPL
ncbi:hypothetical protein [Streptomyces sp. NPDC001401]